MRPCKQCRQPVENGVYICPQCVQYNTQNDLQPPQPIRANPADDLESGTASPHDSSLGQVTKAFFLIIGLLGAMIGLAVFGSLQSFIIGGLIGLAGCAIFLRIVLVGA